MKRDDHPAASAQERPQRMAKPLPVLWERLTREGAAEELFDIVIVGSGYGGSMAAARARMASAPSHRTSGNAG